MNNAYTRLDQYAQLLSELNDHYDEDLDRIVVFRYSDELIRAMNEHEAYKTLTMPGSCLPTGSTSCWRSWRLLYRSRTY